MGYKQKLREAKRIASASSPGKPLLMDSSPEIIMSSIVDIFKKVGSSGGGPPLSSILMHELMPGSVLKDGYGVIDDKFCFYNVWVEVGENVYDPGTEVLKGINGKFDEKVTLGTEEKGTRIDDEVGAKSAKISFDAYLRDPTEWWKNSPPGYLRIRKFVNK
jgi:hypothetical protein